MFESKKQLLIGILMWFTSLCSLGMVVIDLFLYHMSKIVAYSLILLSIGLLVYYIVSYKRSVKKVITALLVSILIFVSIVGVGFSPVWNSHQFKQKSKSLAVTESITSKQAHKDLKFIMSSINHTHPLFIEGVPLEFQEQYDLLAKELDVLESINIAVFYRKVQRVLSTLNDAHTVSYGDYSNPHYFKDLWKLREEGYKLISIDGVLLEDFLAKNKNLFCYEVESWGMNALTSRLVVVEGLDLLGFDIDSGITYGFVNSIDEKDFIERTLYRDDFITFDRFVEYNGRSTYKQDVSEAFVYYTIDEKNSLALLTLNECNFNDEYKNCLEEMFIEVRDKNINHLAVDLRGNGGGSSLVANEFISYLDCDSYLTTTYSLRLGPINVGSKDNVVVNNKKLGLTYDGEVYILSSAKTFSSAMLFTEFISDNDLGTVIGEAPANTPNGFGEVITFQLPESRLNLSVSCKQFYRANPEIKDIVVEPDFPCDDRIAEEVLLEIIKEF